MRLLFLSLFLLPLPLCAGGHWHRIWSDEFNGPHNTGPDPAKWNFQLGGNGFGNHELETYTDQAGNIHQDGRGHLIITAIKTPTGYTSARIHTKGKFEFQYGKAEARMKLPRGQGMWPAFWMLGNNIDAVGWPKAGEIDIMENIGKEPATVHGTIHGPGYSGGHAIGTPYPIPGNQPVSDKFHVFAVEWSADSMIFLVDGHKYATMTPASLPPHTEWVYDHPFYLLLNLAVGGSWPGNPDASTQFPQQLIVDWVRVSQKN